jgi:putative transposase
MPPSRTVAPYSLPGRPIASRRPLGHGRHLPSFIPVTNTIEGLHRQIRKAIKTRGHFPDQQAATKLIYLAIIKADAKWQRNRTWSAPRAALKIHFGDRYPG